MPTPEICSGTPIEQYTPEQAVASLCNAPSQSAAEAIWRLLNEETKAAVRRCVHKVMGERHA